MLYITLLVLLSSALTNAFPTHNLQPRQTTNLTFTVTNFTAFMADPYVEGAKSNLSFHLTDPRPDYFAEVDCVIPPTYFSLYAITALYEYCGEKSQNFLFLFQKNQVAVRRTWVDKTGKTFTSTGSLNPYWKENANVTVFSDGKLFTKGGEWLFPATTR